MKNNEERHREDIDKDEKELSEEKKRGFLGGYPVGEKEFYILVHFFWITSFFLLFLFVRMLILISGA